ncbi:MAG: TetR family transcriptional regulator [Candidatus Dadabacteria bacterium]|nr:TetR family transcriptional regulator [Candidatus Dadabacteria bacterium]
MLNTIKSKIKNKELLSAKRGEIINATSRLFVRKGFHATSVREIAKESGMSMGALYDYIRTKEDILFLVCDHIHSTVSTKLRESLGSNKPALQILKKAIKDYFKIIDENQDYMLLLYQETKSLSKKARKYIFNAENELTSIFEDILRQCVREKTIRISSKMCKIVAHNIMVTGHMWAFRRWALHNNFSISTYTNYQTEILLKGIE